MYKNLASLGSQITASDIKSKYLRLPYIVPFVLTGDLTFSKWNTYTLTIDITSCLINDLKVRFEQTIGNRKLTLAGSKLRH